MLPLVLFVCTRYTAKRFGLCSRAPAPPPLLALIENVFLRTLVVFFASVTPVVLFVTWRSVEKMVDPEHSDHGSNPLTIALLLTTHPPS